MADVAEELVAESAEFEAWSHSLFNTHWVLSSLFVRTADSLRDSHQEMLREYHDAIDMAVDEMAPYWGEWASTILPRSIGEFVCSSGHQNHESRTVCAVCSEPLI
jgi:hypothetical protein